MKKAVLQLLLAFSLMPAFAQENVTLQLKWKHSFQFAGYYAAKELGYYHEAGLEVTIEEARPETDPVRNVLEGKAQYGVGTSGLLLARSSGKPVVVLAVIFQHSPFELYAVPGIHNLRDLIGKRLMLEPQSEELLTLLKKVGVPSDSILQIPHSFDYKSLIIGNAEALSGYISNEPYYFRLANYPYQTFSPRDAGIDFYGDNLFTSEKELRDHPARVKAFRAATIRGWNYAKVHREEMIELIMSKYSQEHSRDYWRFQAEQLISLLQPDLVEIGYMSQGRWKHIADTFASIGLITGDLQLEKFVYDAEKPDLTWFYRGQALAILIIILTSFLAYYIYRINRKLKTSLKDNTKMTEALAEKEELWRTIVKTSPDGIAITSLEGVIQQVSDILPSMFGFESDQEMIGREMYDFIDPDFHDMAKSRLAAVLAGETIGMSENRLFKIDGTSIFIESNVTLLHNAKGDATNLIHIIRDISARKRVEQVIRESEEKYRGIFDNVQDVYFETAMDGNILEISPSIQLLTKGQYQVKDLIGRSMYDFYSVADERNALLNALKENGTVRNFEITLINRDGSLNNCTISSKLCFDAQGNPDKLIGSLHDITERKMTEIALAKERKSLADILVGTNAGTWNWNVKTGEVVFNERWAEIMGYTLEELMPVDISTWTSHVHPDDLPVANSALEKNFRKEQPYYDVEFRQQHKDGSWVWVNARGKVMEWTDDGQPLFMNGIHLDITERKKVGEALKLSEEKFSTAFNMSPMAISISRLYDGLMMECNKALTNLSGYSKEELIGKSALHMGFWVHPEDREFILHSILKTGSVTNREIDFRLKDGKIRTASYSSEKIEYGGETCLLSMYEDVSTKKEVENKMKLLAHSLEGISECVSITDTNDQIIYVNESFIKTYGYSEDELIGKSIYMVRPPEMDHVQVRNILPKTMQGGWQGEIMNIRKDGTRFPILLSTSALKDESGKMIALIGVALDITEMRKTKEELMHAKELAEESNRLKSALLNNMSHEIRTPMNAIMGFSDLMKEVGPDEKDTYAGIINESSIQLLSLIDEVMFLSRLQSEKIPLKKSTIIPAELVVQICQSFNETAQKENLQLVPVIDEPYNDFAIQADREKIIQILTYLASNAVRYTFQGRVEIGFIMLKEHIEFFVKDTGIGIPEHEREKIFETFYRGEQAISLAIRGNGLGLNIAKELVTQIGGSIGVTSDPNTGSRFYFTMPLDISDQVISLPKPQKIAPHSRKEFSVLIVDDEPLNIQYLTILLRGSAVRVDHAINGKEAIEMASSYGYSLVLMDMKMPVMGGIEATTLLKKRYPKLPVIAQTAYTFPEERELALNSGCDDFIGKPISKGRLLEILHKYGFSSSL